METAGHSNVTAGFSLLFAAGERPTQDDVSRVLALDAASGGESGEGRLELRANGLTYDLAGLAPSPGMPLPPKLHHYGRDLDPGEELEAITLHPGAPLAPGTSPLPITRRLVGIAAALALPLLAKVVCWHTAQSWMGSSYFTRTALTWLAEGPFPAHGLTAVTSEEEGIARSHGLAFFIGQEMHLEAAEATKLAANAIDHLARTGPLTSRIEFEAAPGTILVAEPLAGSRTIRVRVASA